MMQNLSAEVQSMLEGKQGKATQKSMEILVALGKIYGASRLIQVSSVQIAGVSYDNLGEAGLQWLSEMAINGGKARVLATLNPAGMDIDNWQSLGISNDFATKQILVIDAFKQMGIIPTCTCTPYLIGNIPHFGESIAWSESSAVCYANSVLGARSNREGGPSALASALTGYTAEYGMHLDQHRQAGIIVEVLAQISLSVEFGALGKIIGEKITDPTGKKPIPYIRGVELASVDNLKTFSASIATYGGLAMFHMEGITPEAHTPSQTEVVRIKQADIEQAITSLNDESKTDVDFVSLGCPHLSIQEIAHLADLLRGKNVTKEFWVTTARPIKQMADRMGYTSIIETSGAKFAADTCCVVAPIRHRFTKIATDSAKACYYASTKNRFKTRYISFANVVIEATS